jgi:hypothetical protein
MTFTSISSNAVLFSTTVTNLVNESREISLAIDADSQFEGESAKISAVPHDRGFVMSPTSSSKTFTMIERGYPLVRDISACWFGASSSCFSNYWTQMTDLSFVLVILKVAGWLAGLKQQVYLFCFLLLSCQSAFISWMLLCLLDRFPLWMNQVNSGF